MKGIWRRRTPQRRRSHWQLRPGRSLRAFANPQIRQARAIKQHGVDLGHLAEAQDRIGPPVDTGDPMAVEGHLLVQRPARRLGESALGWLLSPSGLTIWPASTATTACLSDAPAVTVDVQVHDHGDKRDDSCTGKRRHHGPRPRVSPRPSLRRPRSRLAHARAVAHARAARPHPRGTSGGGRPDRFRLRAPTRRRTTDRENVSVRSPAPER